MPGYHQKATITLKRCPSEDKFLTNNNLLQNEEYLHKVRVLNKKGIQILINIKNKIQIIWIAQLNKQVKIK